VLYIQYDQVNDAPHGPGVHEFFAEALGVLDDHERPVERVVLDIRSNSGGEGSLNTEVVRLLIRRPELQHPGSLVVIIGRRTFSAAQALAHDSTCGPPPCSSANRPVRLRSSGATTA
jgi:hypothetical protein